MTEDIRYHFLVDRDARSFSVEADYFIEGFTDPWTGIRYSTTEWSYTYQNSQGTVLDSSSGYAGQSASVEDAFVFDTGAGVAIRALTFEAYNAHDGYGFGYYWYVFDGALERSNLTIEGSNDTDIIFGGSGADLLYGYNDVDWIDGGAGNDRMLGGAGDDTYVVQNAGDRVYEAAGAGLDTVKASVTTTLSAYVETLELTGTRDIAGIGNALINTLAGNDGDNRLIGAGGRDYLIGDEGADTFVYRSVTDSPYANQSRDVIQDFARAEGDHIDLRRIDADTTLAGNQAFDFLGNAPFTGDAGELRFLYSGSKTVVLGDTDGDRAVDFALNLEGRINLRDGDFLL